jgi:hypothetical protein
MPEIVNQLVVLSIAGIMTLAHGHGAQQPANQPVSAVVVLTPTAQLVLVVAALTPAPHSDQVSTAANGTATPAAAPAPANKPPATRIAAPPAKPTAPPGSPAGVTCQPIQGQTYGAMSIRGGPTNRPATEHADLNLGRRGWKPVNGGLALLNLGGPTDGNAPRFSGLFAPARSPRMIAAYQVYNWDFASGRRTTAIGNPAVTLLGFATAPGEIIHVPNAGYSIGSGFATLVLYAEPSRITLKYTREDNVAVGYTLHIENVCVDPRLLGLYRALNDSGRRQLPALRNGQPLGSATGTQILVGIQDSGTWMDPRSRKDWWQ